VKTELEVAQPDVRLVLDLSGVIKEASFSDAIPEANAADWVGRAWPDTVSNGGADKLRRLIDDATTQGVSAFRQVNQRFPSGAEILMEYTAVRLGEQASLVAVGKSLQTVAQLQARLVAAQQAMERDYWKLRQVETRYQRLFQSSSEAVLIISQQAECRILEANPAAARALDPRGERELNLHGHSLLQELDADEQRALLATLARTLEQGAAPGILLHLGPQRAAWMLRASPMNTERGQGFLLQLTAGRTTPSEFREPAEHFSIETLIANAVDAFVVLDADGVVLHANRAFADMVQALTTGSVVGKRLANWLLRPGADAAILLNNAFRHGSVRLFATTIYGGLGAETEVEISVAVDNPSTPRCCGVLIRDVGRRLPDFESLAGIGPMLSTLVQQIGKKGLKELVQDTVSVVERHYVESALETTDGNRTAAADLLRVSRQSLYAKLNRYGLEAITARKPDGDAV